MKLITLQVTTEEFELIRECIHIAQIEAMHDNKNPNRTVTFAGKLNGLKYHLNKQREEQKVSIYDLWDKYND